MIYLWLCKFWWCLSTNTDPQRGNCLNLEMLPLTITKS